MARFGVFLRPNGDLVKQYRWNFACNYTAWVYCRMPNFALIEEEGWVQWPPKFKIWSTFSYLFTHHGW